MSRLNRKSASLSMEERGSFVSVYQVEGNSERDLLKSNLIEMKLRTDYQYRITSATEGRPDLISAIYYGSFNYGWLISLHNEFLDPFNDYYAGRLINIPSMEDYYKFFNRNSIKRG